MEEPCVLMFDYDVILGQSYKLVPMQSTLVPANFIAARDRLISATGKILQQATNCKHK